VVGPTTVRHDGVVDAAHAEGLLVHAWSVRDENRFLDEAHRVGRRPRCPRQLARRDTRAPATVG
jgi:glycerophosphoryl diester phosphodiesterase